MLLTKILYSVQKHKYNTVRQVAYFFGCLGLLQEPRHWLNQRNPEASMQRPRTSLDAKMGGGSPREAVNHKPIRVTIFGLTAREIEVVGWVPRGMIGKSIAS